MAQEVTKGRRPRSSRGVRLGGRHGDLVRRAQKIKLVAMDVDGVLTGGEIIVLESGEEIKMWNAKDRLVMALLRDHGRPLSLAFLTGRTSRTVQWSARDLGVEHVVLGSKDKRADLEAILKKLNISWDETAFIGDDLIDLGPLRVVGFSACPADAAVDVRSRVHYLSPISGGRGVARDVIEFILRAQNKWDAFISPF